MRKIKPTEGRFDFGYLLKPANNRNEEKVVLHNRVNEECMDCEQSEHIHTMTKKN